jgi:very-short-patch-repair endonuclease
MDFDDASRALVELAASRHNAFHSSEAADISAQRLRRAEARGELTRLGPRIWSVTALGRPPGQALRAATLRLAGGAACHRSAGWLHGWFDQPPSDNDVWVPTRGRRAPAGIRLQLARSVCPRRDVVEVDGIRCLSQAATLCLLGRVESDETIERCLDAFLLEHSMRWLVDTLNRLSTVNGSGPAALVRVLAHPGRNLGRVESPMERLTAGLLASADLPPIVLQHPVEVGETRYRIDLAMPEIKLGVESHSRRFHWGRQAEEGDNARDLALASAGWTVLYVTWAQLQDPARFVEQVTDIAALRTQQRSR